MPKDDLKAAFAAIFPIVEDRFRRAHSLAAAAKACAQTGDLEAAFYILQDIDGPAYDAKRLLDGASVMQLELRD